MSKLSKLLELIELEYPDHVKIPDYWNDLIERLEDVLVRGKDVDAGVALPGDLKMSARDADHGRWLKLDGRELSQAQIEAALGLAAGEAADFVALMGTGGASKYGAAAAGKVKLKDARRKFAMSAGGKEDGDGSLTERKLTDGGGAESVKLTANQSGVKAHGHTINDPEHNHAVTDPEHSHGASQPAHTHTATQAAHSHSPETNTYFLVSEWTGNIATGPAGGTNGNTNSGVRNTSSVAPAITVNSAQPSVTVNKAKAGVTVNKGKTGITVNNNAGEEAAEAHPNIPPFEVLGYMFIRV